MIRYQIYPSLLDCYADYRNHDEIWETYWGSSDHPGKTIEEYREEQFHNVIDRINRVPYSSAAADRGTALNNLIDALVTGKMDDTITPWTHGDKMRGYAVNVNDNPYYFPTAMADELSAYFNGCLTQQFLEADLPTKFGEVRLYGFADYVDPFCIHDLKTTTRYSYGKYADHWQWATYMYCANEMGMPVKNFEYNVVEIGKSRWQTYTEGYQYNDAAKLRLTAHVEDFILFIEAYRDLITDKKIFNQQ